MAEFSIILRGLRIDGQSIECQHAVLIGAHSPDIPGEWTISLLGVKPRDLRRLTACRSFSATGSQGSYYSGQASVAPGASHSHVRLAGHGLLRELTRAS